MDKENVKLKEANSVFVESCPECLFLIGKVDGGYITSVQGVGKSICLGLAHVFDDHPELIDIVELAIGAVKDSRNKKHQ